MKIAILDFKYNGHHQLYAKSILNTSKNIAHFIGHSFLAKADPLFNSLHTTTAETELSFLKKIKLLKSHLKKHEEVALVICLEADQISKFAIFYLLFGKEPKLESAKIGGIWFRSNFLYRKGNIAAVRRGIILHFLTKWAKYGNLLFLDDKLAAIVGQRVGKPKETLWCPEPFGAGILSLKKNHYGSPIRILMAGCHEERKGTYWALCCIAETRLKVPISLHIIGEIRDQRILGAIEACKTRGIQLEVESGFVSNDVYKNAFKKADIILLPYRDFGGSSGVLVEAAQYQRPVLATDFGSIGRIVKQCNCGRVFRQSSATSFINVLNDMLTGTSSEYEYKKVLKRCSSGGLIRLTSPKHD